MPEKRPAPDNHLKVEAIRAKVHMEVERTMQSKRLGDYPLLVFAPLQESHAHPHFGEAHEVSHEAMLRVENNGTPVADIVAAAGDNPDHEVLAKQFGTTAEHVRQSLAYVEEHGPEA